MSGRPSAGAPLRGAPAPCCRGLSTAGCRNPQPHLLAAQGCGQQGLPPSAFPKSGHWVPGLITSVQTFFVEQFPKYRYF